jgi:hypothetical protein
VFSQRQRAAALGTDLVRLLGKRDSDAQAKVRASSRKARAFTLFVNAYEEAGRAATFLRWYDDDVEALVPSLFSKHVRAVPLIRARPRPRPPPRRRLRPPEAPE